MPVRNADLIRELDLSRDRLDRNPDAGPGAAMTPELARMLDHMVWNYARKPNFNGYSYLDDMKADALVNLCRVWPKFDPSRQKYPNPFAYFTTCIHRAFLSVIEHEKKAATIRDDLMEQNGFQGSYNRQVENATV
ncbi:hypothetical protein [Pacificispira sp.]|uniref:hypothetical protein n=1 Tax=Pacificispira sp. TaxID=2888761 RepID=UPI003BA9880C